MPFLYLTVRDTVRDTKRDGGKLGFLPVPMLEPVVGLEPTTCCLRNSCSTTELHRHALIRR